MPTGQAATATDAEAPHPSVEAWLLAVLGRATAYAASLLRDPAAAEDVVQDCCVRLLRKAGDYDLCRDGTKLLFRSITNACINRTQRRRPVFSLDSAAEGEAPREAADGKASGPDAHAAANELDEAVRAALATLPPEQRAAVELKSLGHSQAEIGAALDRTPTHVGVLIHRARKTLKVKLKPFLPEDYA